MTKFKQGMRFRHDNTRDTDILVIGVEGETSETVTLMVAYLYRNTGKAIPGTIQPITIQLSDADSWKTVVGK